MAPRVPRGKKGGVVGAGVGGGTAYPPPSSPTRVHTHCRSEGRALRASPAPPAGSAHAGRPARGALRKKPAPRCTCSPAPVRAWLPLCLPASWDRRPPTPSTSPGQVTPAFASVHTGILALFSGTALLAFLCQACAGGRATKVTAPGPLPISSISPSPQMSPKGF